jgi:hypothetical protein
VAGTYATWNRGSKCSRLSLPARNLLALSMTRQMVPGTQHSLAPAAVAIAILGVMIAATFQSQKETEFVANGLICMRNGLACAIPAGFLFRLILRRGAVLFFKPAGAVTGGLAGLAGLDVLEASCPEIESLHIQIWHWGVVFISSLAGVALGAAAELIER